jgi:3',5'-cyclic-AMP phosphodiesterase
METSRSSFPDPVTLRCAILSDSHLTGDPEFSLYGVRPHRSVARAIAYLTSLDEAIDCIVHLGDLAQDRRRESYRAAHALLRDCPIPTYFVAGNHDDANYLSEEFGTPLRSYPGKAVSADYTFRVRDHRFIVLDTWHPDEPDPRGRVTAEQLEWLDGELASLAPERTVLFLHHLPLPMGSPWLDEHMIIANGDELHRVLAARRDRLHLVVHGHLHRGTTIVRDGVCYSGVPSVVWQYSWESWRSAPEPDLATPPSYSLLEFVGERCQLVHFPVPAGPPTLRDIVK